MVKLSSFNTIDGANEGREMYLKDITTGLDTEAYLIVLGLDSKVGKQCVHEIRRYQAQQERKRNQASDIEDETRIRLLASRLVIGWGGLTDDAGAPLAFNTDILLKLFEERAGRLGAGVGFFLRSGELYHKETAERISAARHYAEHHFRTGGRSAATGDLVRENLANLFGEDSPNVKEFDAAREKSPDQELPSDLTYLWNLFAEIETWRPTGGMAIQRFEVRHFLEWGEGHGIEFTPFELDILHAIDVACTNEIARQQNEKSKRKGSRSKI